MSVSQNSLKFVKSILLSTTFLVSSMVGGYNSPFAAECAPSISQPFSMDAEIQELLEKSSVIIKEGIKYSSEEETYTLEERKKWILEALGILKLLTERTRIM